MFRFLFIVLAIWGVILIGRHLYRVGRARGEASHSAGEAPTDMVRCAHCGLHVPRSEALCDGGRCFCCTEHREAGGR